MMRLGFLILTLCFWLLPRQAHAWGFWAHQRINRTAVFLLPPEMKAFFKHHIDYLTIHSTDPDARRYAVDGEAGRHFLDGDRYCEYPFDCLPRKWADAIAKYPEDTLREHGFVPWYIAMHYNKLVNAFEKQDAAAILKLSADFGHYIADANVPLHTTHNYNGQLSGQKGIHGLWESRLPELFGEQYNYFIGTAKYIDDPLIEAWNTVLESHSALDSVFSLEKEITSTMPSDQKYSYENRNNVLVKVYSLKFSTQYHTRLDGMVERRLRSAIFRVASLWYSAWVDAGKPDISKLLDSEPTMEEEKFEKKLNIIDREATSMIYFWDLGPGGTDCCMMQHGHDHDDAATALMLKRQAHIQLMELI